MAGHLKKSDPSWINAIRALGALSLLWAYESTLPFCLCGCLHTIMTNPGSPLGSSQGPIPMMHHFRHWIIHSRGLFSTSYFCLPSITGIDLDKSARCSWCVPCTRIKHALAGIGIASTRSHHHPLDWKLFFLSKCLYLVLLNSPAICSGTAPMCLVLHNQSEIQLETSRNSRINRRCGSD